MKRAYSNWRWVTITTLAGLLVAACAGGGRTATLTPSASPPAAVTSAATTAPPPKPTGPVASDTPTAAPGSAALPTPQPPASSPTPSQAVFDPSAFTLTLRPYAQGLQGPVGLVNAGDGSGRLFAVERGGRIRIIQDGQVLPRPFLDVSALVTTQGSEQGLLGLAFHPKYRENGVFFINYTDRQGDTNIVRYRVSDDPNVADPNSATRVLFVDQPFANHNGGHLVFGPDGYLWIGLGDGGSGGDPRGNGQNPNVLLGKMLRIDVDAGDPYGIPPDNPFASGQGGRPEIWALGLRNPWRYSFDRQTGDLYIADVGQNSWEEVNFVPAGSPPGVNFGWNRMEGNHCFPSGNNCDRTGLILPVTEYVTREGGCAVTGGYVYRGTQFPQLTGAYYYADYCSGRIWSLARDSAGNWQSTQLLNAGIQITSFGEDEAGELYDLGYGNGAVYQLTASPR